MVLDERLIKALHVEALRRTELHREQEPHVLFQASTIGAGTLLGFRFPDYSEGIEVSGYHLHFISQDRSRGGHVLDFRARSVRARLDPSTDLHLELPPGVDLFAPDLQGSTHEALRRVEHEG